MSRRSLLFGAVFAGSGVALGAFGAHALGDLVSAERLETWETAVLYQLLHGIALLLLGTISEKMISKKIHFRCMWAFVIGIFLFSGSLYTLVLSDITVFGAITPIGGISFLAGWSLLITGIVQSKKI